MESIITLGLIISIMIFIPSSGCNRRNNVTKQSNDEKQVILGLSLQATNVLSILALELGYFHEENIELTQANLLLLEEQAQGVIREDLLLSDALPYYLDFIYFELMDKVKPDSIKIIP